MYRYLTNEVVILMDRIIAESSSLCFVDFLLFSVLFVFANDCCMLWDSENDITGSTSVALSVVMPVHAIYSMLGR